jgi:hypothetical protein
LTTLEGWTIDLKGKLEGKGKQEVDERREDGRKRGREEFLLLEDEGEDGRKSKMGGRERRQRKERDDREGDFLFGNCPSGIQSILQKRMRTGGIGRWEESEGKEGREEGKGGGVLPFGNYHSERN